ncbi:hypothetical protein QFZ99_003838 [Paraburkholderia atlantica]
MRHGPLAWVARTRLTGPEVHIFRHARSGLVVGRSRWHGGIVSSATKNGRRHESYLPLVLESVPRAMGRRIGVSKPMPAKRRAPDARRHTARRDGAGCVVVDAGRAQRVCRGRPERRPGRLRYRNDQPVRHDDHHPAGQPHTAAELAQLRRRCGPDREFRSAGTQRAGRQSHLQQHGQPDLRTSER